MRSPCCLSPQCLKAAIVEPEETAVARQRLRKHVPAGNEYARNNRITVECCVPYAACVVSNNM
jgi:hypothetical protein